MSTKRVTIQAPNDNNEDIKKESKFGRKQNFDSKKERFEKENKRKKAPNSQDRYMNYEFIGQSYDSLVSV
jgi:hypothetical protein